MKRSAILLLAVVLFLGGGDSVRSQDGLDRVRTASSWLSSAPLNPPVQPAPCAPHDPPLANPATTVTVEVHGWKGFDSAFPPDEVYGRDRSGSHISDTIRLIGNLPDGLQNPTAPQQVLGTRYYGTIPPAYYTDSDIQEVEALEGIPRYALIVAKHAHHVMERSGATNVNFVCHSMGGLVTRYLMEHDLEALVSQGKVARWVTLAGLIPGASLARLFGGIIVEAAEEYGINVIDIEHMMPSWVNENVACDGNGEEGNSPIFGGIYIHHVIADAYLLEEYSLPLLDLINPGFLPNDAVLFTAEQHFHGQAPEARFPAASGELLEASRSYHEADHFAIRDSLGAHAAAAAALLGSRRVRVTLTEMTLLNDEEKDDIFDFGEHGFPPAEIVAESEVSWPYLESLGIQEFVGERDRNNRVVPVTEMFEGDTAGNLGLVLYDSPVLDEVDEFILKLRMREVDWYPTEDVLEYIFDVDDSMGTAVLTLPVEAQTFQLNLPSVVVKLNVAVYTLY